MKKILINCTLIVILILSLSFSAFCEQDENVKSEKIPALTALLEQEKANNQEKLSEIKNILDAEINKPQGEEVSLNNSFNHIVEYNLDEAYKINTLENLMLEEYKKEKDFNKIITNKCKWQVPIKTSDGKSGFASILDGDTLKLLGYMYGGDSTNNYAITDEAIIDIVSKSDLIEGSVTSFRHTYSGLYRINFTVINTTEGQYCIPFLSNEEFIGLENGKVYTISKMMDIMNARFDEQQLIDNPDSNGGPPLRTHNTQYIIIASCSAIVSVAGIVLIVRYLKKNKKDSIK